jgi:hypothetical protein
MPKKWKQQKDTNSRTMLCNVCFSLWEISKLSGTLRLCFCLMCWLREHFFLLNLAYKTCPLVCMILDRFPRLLFLFYITSSSQKPEIFDCFVHDHIKRQAFLISSVRLLCFYFNGWMMSNKLHGCLICGLYMSVSYWKTEMFHKLFQGQCEANLCDFGVS